ncbi:hypothetical protein HanRHA438_Chr05g0214681 [Helianthus annuus]|nr:hypothetical protein HanRHA438_Chr05g0214681 [Helianthus annuus]
MKMGIVSQDCKHMDTKYNRSWRFMSVGGVIRSSIITALCDIIYTESGIIAIIVLPLVFKRNSGIKPHFV